MLTERKPTGLFKDFQSGELVFRAITAIPPIYLSHSNDIFDVVRATSIIFDSNFIINAAERSYVEHFVFAFRERALRKQHLIERDLRVAQQSGDRALCLECRRDLKKLNRQYWNLGAVLKAKILVRRKGTERSRSRSGSQTICTHIVPIFEEDLAQRWLLGIAVDIGRATDARNWVERTAPTTAQNEVLSLNSQYFANAKTDVRKSQFRTTDSTTPFLRKGRQVDWYHSRCRVDFSYWDKSNRCYTPNWRQRLRSDDPSAPGLVRLWDLGGSYRNLRMAPDSTSTS